MQVASLDVSGSRAASARAVLDHILAHARARGIDQATLAGRAGISPEALSRLKKAGSCRLTTALDLARAAGLTRLTFHQTGARSGAASIAARKLSAGRRRPIAAPQLVAALTAGQVDRRLRGHLIGLFEELPIESVHDLILDHDLDYSRLLAMARALGAEGETVDWLAEMAGDGVARAA